MFKIILNKFVLYIKQNTDNNKDVYIQNLLIYLSMNSAVSS